MRQPRWNTAETLQRQMLRTLIGFRTWLFRIGDFSALRTIAGEPQVLVDRLNEAELETEIKPGRRVQVRITNETMKEHKTLIREIIQQGVQKHQE